MEPHTIIITALYSKNRRRLQYAGGMCRLSLTFRIISLKTNNSSATYKKKAGALLFIGLVSYTNRLNLKFFCKKKQASSYALRLNFDIFIQKIELRVTPFSVTRYRFREKHENI